MHADAGLLAIAAFLATSMWGWLWLLRRGMAGRELLAFVPTRPVPWTVVDIAVFIYAFLVLQLTAGVLVRMLFGLGWDHDPQQVPLAARAVMMLASATATLATLLVSVLLIRWHAQATWRDVGIDVRFFVRDLGIGFAAFLVLAPPVYGLQMLLVRWFPSEHPVVHLLRERPDPVFLGISAFAALVVAPLAEEYFFRVLVQGWMHKLNSQRAIEATGRSRSGTWPILASAALFAMMHASHGPDPVPLFFLAIGLGYLYRQTGRMTPCVVVHLLLNACSLGALMLAIRDAA
jgi:membrane protease YdiL (CAAX protease family)